MNRKFVFLIIFILLFPVCWAGAKKESGKKENQPVQDNRPVQVNQDLVGLQPAVQNPYFTGDGGKGIKLGISVLNSQGLNANQNYLPTLVQGVLVSDFSKYSAISVLDRVSMEKVISETLNPSFKEDDDIIRLGHITQTGNWLTGNIIKTSAGYTLGKNRLSKRNHKFKYNI